MEWMQKYKLILQNEENFARLVALGLWIKRSISPWHYLLPGMFIFDYLRRSAAVKNYSATFLFPRKVALDLSLQAMAGEKEEELMRQARAKIKEWLAAFKLNTEEIQEKHIKQISILIKHYKKLLQAEGNDYGSLIKNTYDHRRNYEIFLQELTWAENNIDQAIANHLGNTEDIRKRLEAEKKQVEELRKKEVQKIFLDFL